MRTEKIVFLIVLTGGLFKVMHWPGAGFLLTVSLLFLSVICFPLAFYFFSDKHIKRQHIPLSVAGGMFLSTIPIGVLFKIQHWEGSGLLLIVGLIGGVITTGLVFFFSSKAPDELRNYYAKMKVRTVFWTILAVIFFF